jgi:hypothetical protein
MSVWTLALLVPLSSGPFVCSPPALSLVVPVAWEKGTAAFLASGISVVSGLISGEGGGQRDFGKLLVSGPHCMPIYSRT